MLEKKTSLTDPMLTTDSRLTGCHDPTYLTNISYSSITGKIEIKK